MYKMLSTAPRDFIIIHRVCILCNVFLKNMQFHVAFWYIVCYNRNQQLFNFVFVQGEQKMKDLIFSVFPSENFVDLGLYQFGWERCKPAHSFGPAATICSTILCPELAD